MFNDIWFYFVGFLVVLVIIIVGIVVLFINLNRRRNNMEPNQVKKTSAKDVLLNIGAFLSLYTLVGSLIDLLFTIIDKAYPQIVTDYYYNSYSSSTSISWPVSILVVIFPVFILLMWFLEKEYSVEPDTQMSTAHKGLTYITLVLSGITIIADLITVVYYFINGEALTASFLLKILVLLIVATGIFLYFITDIRGKLTKKLRMIWRFISGAIILIAVVWGFSVLGSPRTQRLIKYDEQKVGDLQNIKSGVESFYSQKGLLPGTIDEMSGSNFYGSAVDAQTQKSYEYTKTTETTYNLCAEFNKATPDPTKPNTYMRPLGYESFVHKSGHQCFTETINPNIYIKPSSTTSYPLNY